MNIYEKLSAISTELLTVAKDLEVEAGARKYKAVSEAVVLRAVKPLEAKYKVYSYPYSRKIIESGTIEQANGKKSFFERIEVIYRFVNMEKTDEMVDITSYGDGIDTQDKSVGKAMTYADKYALLKAYKIVTGEDPEQDGSEDTYKVDTKKTTPRTTSNRDKLVSELKKYEVDIIEFSKQHNLSNKSTDQDFKNALDALHEMVNIFGA